jgi:hypothetical protein
MVAAYSVGNAPRSALCAISRLPSDMIRSARDPVPDCSSVAA